MRVAALGRVRWTVAAEFVTPGGGAGRVHAAARQTGLFVRLDTRRPVPIPGALRSALG